MKGIMPSGKRQKETTTQKTPQIMCAAPAISSERNLKKNHTGGKRENDAVYCF